MAYAYGYSEPYSTADKERSESQKGPRDFFSVFTVSVVETLEDEIRFDINYTRVSLLKTFYTWNYKKAGAALVRTINSNNNNNNNNNNNSLSNKPKK